MERKYRTSHQGIAAYLIMQGREILRLENGKNKQNRPTVYFEFDVDQQTGRDMGDAFFEGAANGNLKQFYDALMQVRQKVYEARR